MPLVFTDKIFAIESPGSQLNAQVDDISHIETRLTLILNNISTFTYLNLLINLSTLILNNISTLVLNNISTLPILVLNNLPLSTLVIINLPTFTFKQCIYFYLIVIPLYCKIELI